MEPIGVDLDADAGAHRGEVGGLNQPLKALEVHDGVVVDPLEGHLGNGAGELSRSLRDDVDVLGADDHVHRLVGGEAAVQALELLAVHAHHAVGVHDAVNDVALANEVGHKGVFGLVIDVQGGADLLDIALVHDHDGVRHGQGLLLVVGDIDKGDAHLLLNVLQLHLHVLAQL